MALTRTQDQVIIDLLTNILRASEKADVLPGQVLRDVVVNAPSTDISDLYNQINQLSINQSISNANLMTTENLDNLLANFGITRKGATNSFGQVTFYTSTLPTANVTIPAGTSLGTNLGNQATQVTFSTQYDIIFNVAMQGVYWNPNTQQYEISVNIVANNPGTQSNVGPFTVVNVLNGNFPLNVTNYYAISGGVDQESNNDFAVRALNVLLGSNVGTATGYDGLVSSQPNVLDALIVGPGDPLMTRDGGFGGKVDIWIIPSPAGITPLSPSSTPSLYIPNWNWADQFTQGFIYNFPYLPVSTQGPITITASSTPSGVSNVLLYSSIAPGSGISYMNPSGTGYHYQVFLADDLQTGHSDVSNDYILWNPNEMDYLRTFNPSGNVALTGNIMSVSINYSYDSTIGAVQTVVDQPNNHIITADVLVKEAEELLVDVSMNIALNPTYTTTTTTLQQAIGSVQNAVASTINNTALGNTIQEADMIQAAMNTSGVTNVIVDSVKITTSRSPYYGVAPIIVTNTIFQGNETSQSNQYFQSNNISITVV